jgi:hypothetical protein
MKILLTRSISHLSNLQLGRFHWQEVEICGQNINLSRKSNFWRQVQRIEVTLSFLFLAKSFDFHLRILESTCRCNISYMQSFQIACWCRSVTSRHNWLVGFQVTKIATLTLTYEDKRRNEQRPNNPRPTITRYCIRQQTPQQCQHAHTKQQ